MESVRREGTIIVGAGPSALRGEMGLVVDSFDTVVRLNRFQTVGYEAHVGSRTDVWYTLHLMMADNWINGRERVPEKVEKRIVWTMSCDDVAGYSSIVQLSQVGGSTLFIDKVARSIGVWPCKDRAVDGQGRAFWSTGMRALNYFLDVERIPVVTLHGFDSFREGWHYYEPTEDMEKSAKYCPHDGHAESTVISELVKQGRVKWLNSPQ